MRSILLVLTIGATLFASISSARADDAAISGFFPGVGFMHAPVTSVSGEQYLGIVRQNLDYSCGAAAVATVLKYAYNEDVTEASVIEGMLQVSDPALVKQRGFSLLDIKNYVDALDFNGQGYRIDYAHLLTINVPTIILLNEDGYSHFVVFRRATPQYVFVADPIRGNQTIRADIFNGMWNGVLFVIAGPTYVHANVLEKISAPQSMEQMANGMPPSTAVLNNALLETIYIPGIDRL